MGDRGHFQRRVGAPDGNWIGPVLPFVTATVLQPFVSQRLRAFFAETNREDLLVPKDLIESGDVTPIVDRTYPLEETADAIRYLATGHARGKVVVTV